jgi:hypothetical protein
MKADSEHVAVPHDVVDSELLAKRAFLVALTRLSAEDAQGSGFRTPHDYVVEATREVCDRHEFPHLSSSDLYRALCAAVIRLIDADAERAGGR